MSDSVTKTIRIDKDTYECCEGFIELMDDLYGIKYTLTNLVNQALLHFLWEKLEDHNTDYEGMVFFSAKPDPVTGKSRRTITKEEVDLIHRISKLPYEYTHINQEYIPDFRYHYIRMLAKQQFDAETEEQYDRMWETINNWEQYQPQIECGENSNKIDWVMVKKDESTEK